MYAGCMYLPHICICYWDTNLSSYPPRLQAQVSREHNHPSSSAVHCTKERTEHVEQGHLGGDCMRRTPKAALPPVRTQPSPPPPACSYPTYFFATDHFIDLVFASLHRSCCALTIIGDVTPVNPMGPTMATGPGRPRRVA